MLFNFIHGFCLFLSDKQNIVYTATFCFLYSFVSDSLFWVLWRRHFKLVPKSYDDSDAFKKECFK